MGFRDAQWAYAVHGLTAPQKAVLVALAHATDDRTHITLVGQKLLAERTSLAIESVRRAAGVLEAQGLITRRERHGANGYRTSDETTLEVSNRAERLPGAEPAGHTSRRADSGRLPGSESSPTGLSEGTEEVNQIDQPERHPESSARPQSRPLTPIPTDWAPTDEHQAILVNKTGISLSDQARKFRAHARAHGWRLADWNAGFEKWLLDARPAPPPKTPEERMRATLALASAPDLRAIHSADPHHHRDDGHGWCPECQERFIAQETA